jgi:hypothetical protein
MSSDWKSEWDSMTIDDLLALREQVQEILTAKLKARQAELERRLRALGYPPTRVDPVKSGRLA